MSEQYAELRRALTHYRAEPDSVIAQAMVTRRATPDMVSDLLAERDILRAGIVAVDALIRESDGVVGLHLNGDVAPWSDLLAGGRYEEWLGDLSAAMAGREGER